jgi:peptide deformylase
MILPIIQYGNPILTTIGKRIENITPEINVLIDNMFDTMLNGDRRGVGLAAHQVGIPIQLCIVNVNKHMVLINPEIKYGDSIVPFWEGCLSFPQNKQLKINRPDSISVKALDRNGDELKFECDGLLSRVIQHECDHLQGVLFNTR